MGIKPGSAAAGLQPLTISDRIQTWLQDSKLGTSGPVQHFVKEYMTTNQIATGIYQNMLTPMMDAVGALSDDERKVYDGIFHEHQRGGDLQKLMKGVPPTIKEAVQRTFDVIRYESEEAMAAAGADGRPDVVPIRRPDGSQGLYSSRQAERVRNARDELSRARRAFVEALAPTDKLVEMVGKSEAALDDQAGRVEQANGLARSAIAEDQNLLENIREEHQVPGKKKTEFLTYGKKKDAATALFGPSGLVEQLTDAMRRKDDDFVEQFLPVVKGRLSRWHLKSVKAEDNPAFLAVKQEIDKMGRVVAMRRTALDEIDKRIGGELEAVPRETREDQLARADERKQLEQRHVNERKALKDEQRTVIEKINGARKLKLQNEDDLYERMKESKLAQGDQATARATKAEADRIYAEVKRDLDELRRVWFQTKREENAIYDRQVIAAEKKFQKRPEQLRKKQEKEKKELAQFHAGRKQFHGSLMEDMRYYGKVMKDFKDAVWENPGDEYRNAWVDIYQKQLFEHAQNTGLMEGLRKELGKAGKTPEEFDRALHENPGIIRELLDTYVDDVIVNPKNFNPALNDVARQIKEEVTQSGHEQLNMLISQGYHPHWIPQAGTFDSTRSSIQAMQGKGVPHVDAAFERSQKMVATRHDVVLGVTKAMSQAMQRDAYIDFVEHSIVPRAVTGSELEVLPLRHDRPQGLGPLCRNPPPRDGGEAQGARSHAGRPE